MASERAASRHAPPFIDPPGYAQHRPEQTLLYRLVEQHYPAFLGMREDDDAKRPDVRALVRRSAASLLRGHISRGAEHDARFGQCRRRRRLGVLAARVDRLGDAELAARRIIGALASILRLAHELVGVGYSEQQELESDRQGVLLGAAAGYDVVGGLNVFSWLARNEIEERRVGRREPPPWTMASELGNVLWDALGQYLASHPATPGRARELAALLDRNESEWRGERFYVGRSNHRDRVSRRMEERSGEWIEYSGTPSVIECVLAPGVSVPTVAEECTTR